MPHQRQLIRQAVVAKLKGATAARDRVLPNRVYSVTNGQLPAVLVYTTSESVAPESRATAPRELDRDLELEVVGLVAVEDGADDAIDALALEIETAMHADRYLAGTAADSVLVSSEMSIEKVGDRLVGGVVLTYSVAYQQLAPEPAVVADEFLRAKTTINLDNQVHVDNDAEGQFNVRP